MGAMDMGGRGYRMVRSVVAAGFAAGAVSSFGSTSASAAIATRLGAPAPSANTVSAVSKDASSALTNTAASVAEMRMDHLLPESYAPDARDLSAQSSSDLLSAIAFRDVSMSAFGNGSSDASRRDATGRPVYAAPVRYYESFENSAMGREWDGGRVKVTKHDKFGRFAGPFRNNSQSVYLAVEPGRSYVLSIDLYFLGLAEGDFQIAIDGETVYDSTFDDIRLENLAANGKKESFDPEIVRGVLTVLRAEGDIAEVTITGASERVDGMWGFDNVQIEEVPDQPLSEFGEGGAGGPYSGGGGGSSDGSGFPTFPNRDDYSSPPASGDNDGGGERSPTPRNPPEIPAPGASALALAALTAKALRRRRATNDSM